MMDWRKPKHRRIGERNGKNDWSFIFNCLYFLVILAVLFYAAFQAGRYFEAKEWKVKLDACEKGRTADFMAYHGPNHYYFRDNGIHYFVKNKKDLENKSKWIKVK